MIDLDLINTLYPEAFRDYVAWLNNKTPKNGSQVYYSQSYLFYDKGDSTNIFSNNVRDLYDYFDGHNIHIEVFKEQVLGKDKHIERWCFDVGIIISKGYTNRRLAEGAAFKQAFRILDTKLCD